MRKNARPFALAVVGLCALLLIAAAVLRTASLRNLAGGVTARLAMGERPTNILLIANNARNAAADDPLATGSAAGQADVILLVRLDPVAHAIYAIMIPRDALVAQPKWHNPIPKIKTLFFMGDQEMPARGPQYMAEAVSKLTGLPVDGFLVANFAGFEQAVDLVGGLSIDVKARLLDPQNSGANFQPGLQHMTGAQALAFIRIRQNQAGNSYRVNDYQRMQAEVEVLGILRNKLLDPSHVAFLLPKFVARMKHNVATNLSQARLIRLGIAMAGAPVYQVPLGSIADSMVLGATNLPGINATGSLDEADYDVLDPKDVQRRLAAFGSRSSSMGLPALPAPGSVRVTLYGSDHLALHLAHLGFAHVTRAGDSTGAATIIYPAGDPAAGWRVARAIGTGSLYVGPGNVATVIVRE